MTNKIMEILNENKEVYIVRRCTLQVGHKKRKLTIDDWYSIEDNLNYWIEGAFATKKEALNSFEPDWRTFNNSGRRFVDFYTGEIACITLEEVENAEKDGIDLEEFIDDYPFYESSYIGIDDFKKFLDEWMG